MGSGGECRRNVEELRERTMTTYWEAAGRYLRQVLVKGKGLLQQQHCHQVLMYPLVGHSILDWGLHPMSSLRRTRRGRRMFRSHMRCRWRKMERSCIRPGHNVLKSRRYWLQGASLHRRLEHFPRPLPQHLHQLLRPRSPDHRILRQSHQSPDQPSPRQL